MPRCWGQAGTSGLEVFPGDIAHADQALGGRRGLWFERGGRAYIIVDAATLDEIQSFYKPQMEQRQELRPREEELRRREADLLKQETELQCREVELEAKRLELVTEEERRGLERKPADDLTHRMNELSRQQDAIREQREANFERQNELSRERAELWKKQDELSEERRHLAGGAERQLRALLTRALVSGIAQEVGRSEKPRG